MPILCSLTPLQHQSSLLGYTDGYSFVQTQLRQYRLLVINAGNLRCTHACICIARKTGKLSVVPQLVCVCRAERLQNECVRYRKQKLSHQTVIQCFMRRLLERQFCDGVRCRARRARHHCMESLATDLLPFSSPLRAVFAMIRPTSSWPTSLSSNLSTFFPATRLPFGTPSLAVRWNLIIPFVKYRDFSSPCLFLSAGLHTL